MKEHFQEDNWQVYNHGLITTKMPHEDKCENEIDKLEKWKDKKTLFARWTTDFDCKEETEWWYCLKDDEFDILALKSKRRYVVNKGINNFDINLINQNEYLDEMYEVYLLSMSEYPDKYRVLQTKEEFVKNHKDSTRIYIGVWDKETKEFVAYVICKKIQNNIDTIIDFQAVNVKPEAVKKEVNAAIGNFVCTKFLNEEKVKYIYDGERNIKHITNYQDYLTKYFGFRKAYCKLNIKYKPVVKIVVTILYPFRKLLKNTNNKFLYNVYCVLYQEEIRRSFDK